MSPLGGLLFAILGIGVGTYASIIGAGGGFIVTPVLLLLFPEKSAAVITAVALAVAGLNAVSGSINYARYRRIDYLTGLLIATAIVPGAVLGAWLTRFVARGPFDIAIGLLMVGLALFIVRRPPLQAQEAQGRGNVTRTFVDGRGTTYVYSFRREHAVAISFAVGVVAALMGVGGGIIMVPVFVRLLHFPPAVATSTSLFAIIFMTLSATILHLVAGDLTLEGWQLVLSIGAGIILGAQVGSRLSQRLRGRRVMQLLALALLVVGVRLLLQGVIG